MTTAYFNELDPFAVQWLRNLMAAGHLPAGTVDGRDVREVKADDVRDYAACHFFGGLGGWALALRLAGWPAARPVWTASLPCQPLSSAGRRKGRADSRHLWPVFLRLLKDGRPSVCLGEQVAGDDGYRWLARVRDDLEEAGYAVGAADLPAACAGAPHVRQRLFWVAHLPGAGWGAGSAIAGGTGAADGRRPEPDGGGSAGFWSDFDLIPCRDGKVRRTQRGLFPLADGLPGRVGRLRAYGNAIVPQVAALFVRAFLEAEEGLVGAV